jgi:hypothetical protein
MNGDGEFWRGGPDIFAVWKTDVVFGRGRAGWQDWKMAFLLAKFCTSLPPPESYFLHFKAV